MEPLFNKVADLWPATLLKEETLTQMLSCDFCEIVRNTLYRTNNNKSFIEQLQATASDYVNKQNNLNKKNLNLR